MKQLITTGIITLSIGLAGPVLAGPVDWETDSSHGTCTSGIGNACTFDEYGYTLTARAYSTTNNSGSGAFEKATLTRYSGGLGVRNPDQGNEGGSPHHALDDNGRDEMIVFENNVSGYSFTGFEIGWKSNDSDISAWVGTLANGFDFTGTRFSDLAGLGFTLSNFSNVPTNTTQSLGSNVGNYLILAPRADSNSEYVKISGVSGSTPTQVPEPGMLALFGIALVGFCANMRRRVS